MARRRTNPDGPLRLDAPFQTTHGPATPATQPLLRQSLPEATTTGWRRAFLICQVPPLVGYDVRRATRRPLTVPDVRGRSPRNFTSRTPPPQHIPVLPSPSRHLFPTPPNCSEEPVTQPNALPFIYMRGKHGPSLLQMPEQGPCSSGPIPRASPPGSPHGARYGVAASNPNRGNTVPALGSRAAPSGVCIRCPGATLGSSCRGGRKLTCSLWDAVFLLPLICRSSRAGTPSPLSIS